MEDKAYYSYGDHVDGDIYYWEKYLKYKYEQKNYLRQNLEEEGKDVNTEDVHKIFIDSGYGFFG